MDIAWYRFILACMVLLSFYQLGKAKVNLSTIVKPSTSSPPTSRVVHISISRSSYSPKLVSSSRFLGVFSFQESLMFTSLATPRIKSLVHHLTSTQKTDFSLRTSASKPRYIPKLSSMIVPHFNEMTSSTLQNTNSVYVPIVNGKKSSGIPLIILVPSAAGGGVFLVLIFLCCCWNHRRLKRKRTERVFQKYYRPTVPESASPDLEDGEDDRDTWVMSASQMKLSLDNNEEEQPKSFQGIENNAFVMSESTTAEKNFNDKNSRADFVSDRIQNDTDCASSNDVEDVNIDIQSLEDGQKPSENISTLEGSALPTNENFLRDDHRASLLVLENLDHLLNNELGRFDRSEEDKDKNEDRFVVAYPFLTPNQDEISLDIGSIVSVIESNPSAGWSWVADEDGDTGWFPTQYLVRAGRQQNQSDGATDHHLGYSIPDQKRLHFAVLQSFSGSSPDELSLSKYDIVSVIENNTSGWSWVNEPNAGTGWFPTNYLEPLVFPKKNAQHQSSGESTNYLNVIEEENQYVYASSEELVKLKKEGNYQEYEAKAYRASHAYCGGNEDELTFKENETILVLQETDTGWWRGSTYLGEGWFPAGFVEDPLKREDPSSQDACYYVSDCNKYQSQATPYEITSLVTEKNLPTKEQDRESIHQVPQAIPPQQAAGKRGKHRAKGATSSLKPNRRPPPPPPAALRPTIVPSSHATLQNTSLSTDTPTITSSQVLLRNTQDTPTIPLPQALPVTLPSSNIQVTSNPPAFEALPQPHASPPQDKTTNKQETEDLKEPGECEGVVIIRPRDPSRNTLPKLITVTKRRSIINPNPSERPPNRPVPIPPPRKVRNAARSPDVPPRPRPMKMPRNKKDDNNINTAPKVVPERPPPPSPEMLDEFRQNRLSTESSACSEGSSNEQQSNEEHLAGRQKSGTDNNNNLHQNRPDVNTSLSLKGTNHEVKEVDKNVESVSDQSRSSEHHNDEIIEYNCMAKTDRSSMEQILRNYMPNNSQKDESIKEEETMASGKCSPKPKPRKRSHEKLQAIPVLDTETENINQRELKTAERNNTKKPENNEGDTTVHKSLISQPFKTTILPEDKTDSEPETPVSSQSFSEDPQNNQPSDAKPRPIVKPRSKSLADVFSSTGRGENGSEPQIQSSPRDNSLSGEPIQKKISDSTNKQHRQYDSNQNRPKPKARIKQK